MTAPIPPIGLFPLEEDQRGEIVAALHARLLETQQYIRSTGFTVCHADCPHCAPRAAHFESITENLRHRRTVIVEALTALGAGPCRCGLRSEEHWDGDHK